MTSHGNTQTDGRPSGGGRRPLAAMATRGSLGVHAWAEGKLLVLKTGGAGTGVK